MHRERTLEPAMEKKKHRRGTNAGDHGASEHQLQLLGSNLNPPASTSWSYTLLVLTLDLV